MSTCEHVPRGKASASPCFSRFGRLWNNRLWLVIFAELIFKLNLVFGAKAVNDGKQGD